MNTKEHGHDSKKNVAEAIQLPSKKKIKSKVKAVTNAHTASVKRPAKALIKGAESITDRALDGAKNAVKNVTEYAKNSKEWIMDDKSGNKKLVAGAIIGGAVGCIAATMIASRNSKGIAETCKEYSDKFKNMIEDMGSTVSEAVHDKAECVTDKAHDVIESVKSEIGEFPGLDNADFKKGLIVGAAIGGLLGSGSTMLYNKLTGGEHAKALQSPTDWKAMASKALQLLDVNHHVEDAVHKAEDTVHKAEAAVSTKASDILDFAAAGIQLWKNMKSS